MFKSLSRSEMKAILGGSSEADLNTEPAPGVNCACLPTGLTCAGCDPLRQWACSTANYTGITCCPIHHEVKRLLFL